MAFKITKSEVTGRMGFFFFGLFSGIGAQSVREWIETNLHINPLIVMIVGLVATLYYFDFK